MNYDRAKQLLAKARNKNNGEPIANNTRLYERENNSISIQLHNTDIVTYKANGDIVLNSGGWKTVTTKSRINEYLEKWIITQHNSIWYLGHGWDSPEYLFEDGITIHPDGSVDGKPYNKEIETKNRKLKKQVKKYVDGFVKALVNKQIPQPSTGDCWYCCLKTKDGKSWGDCTENTDHIYSHFKEKYYVPSLLVNAIETFPVCDYARGSIGFYLGFHETDPGDFGLNIVRRDVKRSLKRYIYKVLGLAS